MPTVVGYSVLNGEDIKAFFKHPKSHLALKYSSSEKAHLALMLIILSFSLFIWEIVMLAAVGNVFTFIAVVEVVGAFYAMCGFLDYYKSQWVYIWSGIHCGCWVVSLLWNLFTKNINVLAWPLIAFAIWAVLLGLFIFYAQKVRKM